MTIRKYSKKSDWYSDIKSNFFEENNELLEDTLELNQFYTTQSKRKKCKLCDHTVDLETSVFTNHGVNYIFCEHCGHLNGSHKDTQEFADAIYIKGKDGEKKDVELNDYSTNYVDERFVQRVNHIYAPKFQFMNDYMPHSNFNLLDVGCGAGHFVAAAIRGGGSGNIEAEGVDVNREMIEFGNVQMSLLNIDPIASRDPLKTVNPTELNSLIKNTEASVISALGVIEHLSDLPGFVRAFHESTAEFVFYSVPMFSFSVIIENIFSDVFPRHLREGHTHLFTEKSIEFFNELLNCESIAEWRFGTDMLDLYRSITVELNKEENSPLSGILGDQFQPLVDDLQSVLDENHFCSEIHVLAQKTN